MRASGVEELLVAVADVSFRVSLLFVAHYSTSQTR